MSQSLTRGLDLLVLIGMRNRSLGELAEITGLHKSTVLRSLQSLESRGFVYHDAHHHYRLGAQLFELAGKGMEQWEIRGIASPYLAALNRGSGHTIHLAVLDGDEVFYLDKYDSLHPVRMYSRVGYRVNLSSAAVAKVLIANLPEDRREDLLAHIDYPARTPRSITSPDAMREELDLVRRRGWAEDREENERSINCVGAPVFGADGTAVAAVSVSVPDSILPREELLTLVPELVETTRRISVQCGHSGSEA